MNYEQKYKEALAVVQEILNSKFDALRVKTLRKRFEDVFPELKESGDEGMRKALYADIRTYIPNERGDKYIAWLEEQDEQHSPVDINKMVDEFAHTEVKGYGIPCMIEVAAYRKGIEDALEKQDEQPTDKVEPNPAWSEEDEEMLMWLCRIIHTQRLDRAITLKEESELGEWMDKWLNHNPQTKQGEKRPTENVEIKFCEGDKVVSNQDGKVYTVGTVYYVTGDNICMYDTDGNRKWTNNDDLNRNYHLWTIQDAKDGDVLVTSSEKGSETNEQIFLFKAINSRDYVAGCIEYYFRLFDGVFYENTIGYMGTTLDTFYPAAKEQCDLLFSKMRDSGYEWDAEKKELKKIEPKSVDKIDTKFKVGDWCIDNEDGVIFQIVKVLDNTYTYKTNEGKEYSCTHCSLENDAKLWTIQDANDGDVLVTKKGNPFLYDKNRFNTGFAYYYAGLGANKELTLKSPHHMLAHFGGLSSVSPATKEQRDLLFSKMRDSGYEWDAEKKELKKIEDKTLDADKVIEWICKYWPFSWGNFSFTVDEAVKQFKKDFEL